MEVATTYRPLSTTALIRKALGEVDGNVSQAIGLLYGWTGYYSNAKIAAEVIRKRAKGADRVTVEASGFIVAVAA